MVLLKLAIYYSYIKVNMLGLELKYNIYHNYNLNITTHVLILLYCLCCDVLLDLFL